MTRNVTTMGLVLLLSLACFEHALGQIVFDEEVNYEAGFPQEIKSGDLDGDGDIDLLAVSHSVSLAEFSFSVMFNDGTGHFPVIVKTPTSFQTAGGDLVDLDGDGDLDLALATCCYTAGRVYLFSNDGSGTFTDCGLLTCAAGTGNVRSGDFNSDLIQDIAVSHYPAGAISVFLGLGDCTFATPTVYSVGTTWITIARRPLDVDNDGDLDLVVGDQSAGVVITMLNDGSGSFSIGGSYPCGLRARYIDAGDFDKDGNLDLAVPRGTSDQLIDTLTVVYNDGFGAFGNPVHYEARLGAYDALAADFDRDGWVDIAVTEYDQHELSLFLNNRSGGFFPRIDYDINFAGSNDNGPLCIVGADLDWDGDSDAAVTHSTKVQVLQNQHCAATVVVIDTVIIHVTDTVLIPTAEACPYMSTDVNGDTATDVLDVTKVINVAFRGEPEALSKCDLISIPALVSGKVDREQD